MQLRALRLLLGLGLTFGALAVSASPATFGRDVSTHRCKAGVRHAVIRGKHECLDDGRRCTKKYDREYHSYGFHCHTGRLERRSAPSLLPAQPSANLALKVRSAPDPVSLGSELTYRITITNFGPDFAPRSILTADGLADYIADGTLKLVRVDDFCQLVGHVFTCIFSDIANATVATATVVVKPTTATTLAIRWTVTPSDADGTGDPDTANNSLVTQSRANDTTSKLVAFHKCLKLGPARAPLSHEPIDAPPQRLCLARGTSRPHHPHHPKSSSEPSLR
jgi:uncharacterized protein DUF11